MPVDWHDDFGEFYLLAAPEDPELLKTASWVERDDLQDRDFALIRIDRNGQEHRKFASYDGPSTQLSLFYLLNSDHGLLPLEEKVAAVNLVKAAMAFGVYDEIPDETLELLAGAIESPLSATGDGRRVWEKVASAPPTGWLGRVTNFFRGGAKGMEHMAPSVTPAAVQQGMHQVRKPKPINLPGSVPVTPSFPGGATPTPAKTAPMQATGATHVKLDRGQSWTPETLWHSPSGPVKQVGGTPPPSLLERASKAVAPYVPHALGAAALGTAAAGTVGAAGLTGVGAAYGAHRLMNRQQPQPEYYSPQNYPPVRPR